ncbi:hypothetical protein PS15m_001471 [Mucor circinelloides]
MCVFYNKNEINHQVTIEEIEGDSDASTESEEDESAKDDDIDSDDSEEMLMMLLEDDFQEQKSNFGQIYMKEDPLNPGMYILSAKKRRFYVPLWNL